MVKSLVCGQKKSPIDILSGITDKQTCKLPNQGEGLFYCMFRASMLRVSRPQAGMAAVHPLADPEDAARLARMAQRAKEKLRTTPENRAGAAPRYREGGMRAL